MNLPPNLSSLLIDLRSPVAFRDSTIPGAVNKTLRQLTEYQKLANKKIQIRVFGADDDVSTAIKYMNMFGFTDVSQVLDADSKIKPRRSW